MQLISVNTAMPTVVEINGNSVNTGIYKTPQSGKVRLSKTNLAGDGQADLTVHGGEFQAVYSYPVEHYAYWQKVLSKPALPFGTFGENFTVSGLLEDEVYVGDIFSVGSAVIQATMPRIPCFKFGHKVGKPDILSMFLHSGRSGFYHKVLQEGDVAAGDSIALVERQSQSISIRMALGLQKLEEGDASTLEYALRIEHLPPLLRNVYTQRLQHMQSAGQY
ncbi:MOSC domain-containing protein [Methylotenera sp. N17]|uniref:MOSC domain-containing protein n=1 Tax=Methylotenera sp. N17 TaxID=1502761 RepID=UPI0006479570|nr:MOSC domain-containing protein [Methylotenera sp. N17]